MKVAEKDKVVQGMLEDEYWRSQEVVKALHAKVENYPKGALNVRRKKGKGKEYVYHYLVRRDGKKVINQHIAERDLAELQKRLEERDKYQKEILAYKKRMVYLERLLKEPNREGVMKNQLPDNLFPERVKDLLHAISGVGFFERSVVIGSCLRVG